MRFGEYQGNAIGRFDPETNIRRVYVDDSKNPFTLWIGGNHGASIVKVEPHD